jgi:hypothetical protein
MWAPGPASRPRLNETTDVVEDNGKVVITVTADGEAGVVQIQKRAEHWTRSRRRRTRRSSAPGWGPAATGAKGAPVVMTDVTLEIATLTKGVTISLSPEDSGAVGDLARMARERVTAMASGGGGEGAELGAEEEWGDNE